MQTSSYASWMRRPLSSAVCPTPDIWPEERYIDTRDTRGAVHPAVPRRQLRGTRGASRRSAQTMRRRRRGFERAPVGDVVTARISNGRRNMVTDTAEAPVSSKEEFMNEEKLRILKMLEDGKVSADEAARLMEALEKSEPRSRKSDIQRKWLHIRVQEHGRDTVNMKVPLALLKFGFKLAPQAMRHHAEATRRKAERMRARAERQREKTERNRERAIRKAQRTGERMRTRLQGELGEHPGLDIDDIVNQAVRESMQEMEQAINESLEEAEEAVQEVARNGLGVFAGKDFDLDLDKILEMAESEGFDGRILDVHDDEDDEHVTITLE
jgi:hypothetical protein